jgi:amino-acid N-acetyltransferase
MASETGIRTGRPEDLPVVTSLLTEAGLPLAGLDPRLGQTLIASQEERVVGCVALEVYGKAALLRSLVVAPGIRGHGLGERLAAEVLDLARREGVRDVYLLTETASQFFPRFGFLIEDRATAPTTLQQSVEFRSACPASAVMMHARLQP